MNTQDIILTVLYYERTPADPHNTTNNFVEVTVRRWQLLPGTSSRLGEVRDVVLESLAVIDGKETHHRVYAYDGTKSDAFYQRLGIQTYDVLRATHPNLPKDEDQ